MLLDPVGLAHEQAVGVSETGLAAQHRDGRGVGQDGLVFRLPQLIDARLLLG